MRKSIQSFIEYFHFDFLKFIPSQTFKYMVCGGSIVVIDTFIFNFLNYFIFKENDVLLFDHLFKPHTISQIISFSISFPLGFIFNRYIVFTESQLRGRIQLFRYGLTALASFVLSVFLIKLFFDIFHINAFISKNITTILVIAFSYFAQQYFSFKVKGKKSFN